MEKVSISVVVPVYNEEKNIGPLSERIFSVLERVGKSWEVIIVDDGSEDKSWDRIQEVCRKESRARGVRLARNFGQTMALSAGFQSARGEVVVSIDGDGQNDPDDIPLLLDKLGEGYDVVSGWRRERKDSFFKRRLPSLLANRLISRFSGVKVHDFGCTLKAYRSWVLRDLKLYGEMHRMIVVLAKLEGARIGEVEVRHYARSFGRSKYSISRVLSVIFDLLSLKFFGGYFTRPVHFFGLLGFFSLFFGFFSFVAVLWMKFKSGMDMTGNPFLIFGVFMVIVGIQLVLTGLLGEISIRTYFESQGKSGYVVRETVGIEKEG